MMGLEQIKKANANPREHAKSEMSEGQLRRNDAKGKAYWSETDPDDGWEGERGLENLSTAADHGRLNEIANPVPGTDWTVTDEYAKDNPTVLPLSEFGFHAEPVRPVGMPRKPWVADQTMTQYVPTVEEQIKAPYAMGDWEFESVRLLNALREMQGRIEEDYLRLSEALRMFRRQSTKGNEQYLLELISAFKQADKPEYKLAKQIEDVIRTIDAVAPLPKPGYNAKLSLNYAFKPVRDALARLINM